MRQKPRSRIWLGRRGGGSISAKTLSMGFAKPTGLMLFTARLYSACALRHLKLPSISNCDNTTQMGKQTLITQKRRGPKPTGKGELVGLRLQPELLKQVDEWRDYYLPNGSRPEAIRKMIEHYIALGEPQSAEVAKRWKRDDKL